MKKLLFLAAFVAFGLSSTQPANADFVLLDDFDDAAAHSSTPGGTSKLIKPPNTGSATDRTLFGAVTPALTVINGNLTTTMIAINETASLILDFAAPQGIDGLALSDYGVLNTSGTTFYEIFFNGDGTPGTGVLVGAGALPALPDANGFGRLGVQTPANNVTRLELRLTNTTNGATLFSTSAISATPEPASMGLLALALCGGMGWRRKRKALKC